MDGAGNLYIADTNNNRIRKLVTLGVITTVAGTGTRCYGGDGGAATSALLNNPDGVAVDSAGNIYIADTNNNRIRKVNTSGDHQYRRRHGRLRLLRRWRSRHKRPDQRPAGRGG